MMLQHFIGNPFRSPQFGTTGGGLSPHYQIKSGSGYLHQICYMMNPAITSGTYYVMIFDSANAPVSGVSTPAAICPFIVPATPLRENIYGTAFLSVPVSFQNGLWAALSNNTSPVVYNNSYTGTSIWCIAEGVFS